MYIRVLYSSSFIVSLLYAFILLCQCKITIANAIFSYMLVKTPSGEHHVAYAVCYPEICLTKVLCNSVNANFYFSIFTTFYNINMSTYVVIII